MIILIARCELDPAALPELKPVLARTMQATWDESDCLSYSIAIEDEASGVVSMVERWRDEASLLAYLATPTMQRFRSAIKPAIVSLDARIFDVAGERPLPMPPAHWTAEVPADGLRLVTNAGIEMPA